MKTVERMFEGPLDVVGDIHGQVDALRNLLRELDYSPEGSHPEDRKRLVAMLGNDRYQDRERA